ncbi:hypothetical protein C8R46DRAFT_1107589 [Mycena filopes]|nr:hypothetical protein C8R46DRAFT_1107589 [Mycena filopes]
MANGCAINIWSALLPLRWKSVELDVTAICEDASSDTQTTFDSDRDGHPLASVTGALLADDQSQAESSNETNSEDSSSTRAPEVNDALEDELEIDPATAHAEGPNPGKRGRIWQGLRRTWKDSFQKSSVRTDSANVTDGQATSDLTGESSGAHRDRSNKDPPTGFAGEKHDGLEHPMDSEDEEINSFSSDGDTRAHPVGIANAHNSPDIEANTILDSSGLNVFAIQLAVQEPTCTNLRIRSVDDANKIFFAVHCNILHLVARRLNRDERAALRTGCVYAWEERSQNTEITGIGIERFTEGRRWSPFRSRDEFLFYYERWVPDPNQPEVTEPPPGWIPLVKQTYSVWVQTERGRRKWHLTAYADHLGAPGSTTDDHLGTLDDMPDILSLEVPPDVFMSTRIGKRENVDPDRAMTAGARIYGDFLAPITPHPEASNSTASSSIQWTQTQRPPSPGPYRGAGEP